MKIMSIVRINQQIYFYTFQPPTDETQKALANILSKCKSLEFLHSAPPINISYLKKNDGRLPNSLKYLKVGEHWKSEESDKVRLQQSYCFTLNLTLIYRQLNSSNIWLITAQIYRLWIVMIFYTFHKQRRKNSKVLTF